jgi:hypothetical protein
MPPSKNRLIILVTAWITILAVALHKIILQEIFNIPVSESLQNQISALIVIAGFLLTFLWKAVRALRSFFGLFFVFIAAQWLAYSQVERLFPVVKVWLKDPSFDVNMIAEKSLGLIAALIVIGFLWIIKRDRAKFFLARGNLSAPVEPVGWLGVKQGEKWNKLGLILSLYLSLGTLTFLILAGTPPPDLALKALPFLPAVLLAAAMNAFYEEMTYKASFLAVLVDVVGKQQALWLMAAFFGLFHYYGIPYGIVGVLMAAFLGWLLGKSMLETGGLFWAWFLHFLQDVLIFAFLAIGSITPGG